MKYTYVYEDGLSTSTSARLVIVPASSGIRTVWLYAPNRCTCGHKEAFLLSCYPTVQAAKVSCSSCGEKRRIDEDDLLSISGFCVNPVQHPLVPDVTKESLQATSQVQNVTYRLGVSCACGFHGVFYSRFPSPVVTCDRCKKLIYPPITAWGRCAGGHGTVPPVGVTTVDDLENPQQSSTNCCDKYRGVFSRCQKCGKEL